MKNVKRQQSWFGTKRIKRSRRRNPHAASADLPSGLLARITDDGCVFTATIINGRGVRDFVRLFCDDFDELRLRLAQYRIAEVSIQARLVSHNQEKS